MKLLFCVLTISIFFSFRYESANGQTLSKSTSQDSILDIHGVPKVLFRPKFEYPLALHELKKEATVIVEAEIDTNGLVRGVRRILHSTDCAFDSLAVSLAVQYRFVPIGFYGKKSRVRVTIPLYFDTRARIK